MTAVFPSGNLLPEAGAQVTAAMSPSTVSNALGVGKLTFDPVGPLASTVLSPKPENTGAVVSATVIVKFPTAWFPLLSRAVQATEVPPNGNVPPDAGTN